MKTKNFEEVKHFPFGEFISTQPKIKDLPSEMATDLYLATMNTDLTKVRDELLVLRNSQVIGRLEQTENGIQVFIRNFAIATVSSEIDVIALCVEYSIKVPPFSKLDNLASLAEFIAEIELRINPVVPEVAIPVYKEESEEEEAIAPVYKVEQKPLAAAYLDWKANSATKANISPYRVGKVCEPPKKTCKIEKGLKEQFSKAALYQEIEQEYSGNTVSYQNKDYRRPLQDILADFTKKVPTRFIKQKTKKGIVIDYIPWYWVNQLLDYFAPGFEFHIETERYKNQIIGKGFLTIMTKEGPVTRQAITQEDLDNTGFGGALTRLQAALLRRCAALFGLGRHLWQVA